MADAYPAPPPLTRQQRRARARREAKAGAALVLGALAATAAAPPAEAATFTVSNLNDSGSGSLRQAILDANGAAGADVVAFQAGLTGTVTLTSGELAVTDSVDIQGPGEAALTVSGNGASRVFYLYDDAALLDVTISNLTVTGGSANRGGGIATLDESLTLDHVTLQGNAAVGDTPGDGGGLWASGPSLTLALRHCTISGNTAEGEGGGAYVGSLYTPTVLEDSVFQGNQAGGDGGAISFFQPHEAITIERTTVSGNTAGAAGGGISLYDTDGGTFTLRESTISGNDAATGGGAFLEAGYTNLLFENDTISGNDAGEGAGGGLVLYNSYAGIAMRNTTVAGNGAATSGGGISLVGGRLAIDNSIVADDTAPTDPDLAGSGMFDVSSSLIETPGAAAISDNGGNLLGQDPQLGPLADNGGPTQTQRPAAGSPVVNAGDPSFTPPPATDQRGFDRVSGGRIDMGAVELSPGTIQFALTAATVGENAGSVTITATRTGGADGAVSASYATFDGTAVSPADFLAAMGTFNWADGDTAPKSIQVTIVDDALVEPSEVFTVQLSAPAGGAALGTEITEAVTIEDNDGGSGPGPAEVPTLGEMGQLLLAGLLGSAGMLALRRRRAPAS